MREIAATFPRGAWWVACGLAAIGGGRTALAGPEPAAVAAAVDAAIERVLEARDLEPEPRVGDAAFLRRASLDIAGALPTPGEVTLFVLDPDPGKRARLVEELVARPSYARRWSRYWRDAIAYRAQDRRFEAVKDDLEDWLREQFAADRGWNEVAAELITATGDVGGNGRTGLIVAQMAQAPELAAETSRLFLGIQIQCAQCHDHPYDAWKREEFHELAAFFPRVRLQRKQGSGDKQRTFEVVSADAPPPDDGARGLPFDDPGRLLARLDKDGDGRLVPGELPQALRNRLRRAFRTADRNKDGGLDRDELRSLRPPGAPRGGRRGEHLMPDLEDPEAPGTLVHPVLFTSKESPGEFASDLERRRALARYITGDENPWFARAMVNRVWKEMIGRGFVEPIDDMGPERTPEGAGALDALAAGFRASGYSLRWLVRTVATTRAYQRGTLEPGSEPEPPAFTGVYPARLPADTIFDALVQVLELGDGGLPRAGRGAPRARGPRGAFQDLFGFDPSTPFSEVAGTVPQALFLMNSPLLEGRVEARPGTVLGRLLDRYDEDRVVLNELYLRVLAREPLEDEVESFLFYRREVPSRKEAFEDLSWSLVNSAEFLMRR